MTTPPCNRLQMAGDRTFAETAADVRHAIPAGDDAVLGACADDGRQLLAYSHLAGMVGQMREAGGLDDLWRRAEEALRRLAREHMRLLWATAPDKTQADLAFLDDFSALVDEQCRFGRAIDGLGTLHPAPALVAWYPHLTLETLLDSRQQWRAHRAGTDAAGSARFTLIWQPLTPAQVAEHWLAVVDAGNVLPFPWRVLVQWHVSASAVEPDRPNERQDPILPRSLVMTGSLTRRSKGWAPAAFAAEAYTERQAYIPGFSPDLNANPKSATPRFPVLPLALYDLGSDLVERRGRGAPLAMRIFLEMLFSVPQAARIKANSLNQGVKLPPWQLRNFLRLIYGGQARQYRRARNWAGLRRAFEALERPQARIPICLDPSTGAGVTRRVVVPLTIPLTGRLDEPVEFAVFLPPGSDSGPLIDRAFLRRAGRVSAPLYRLVLSLAFYWFDPGRTRYPVGRGPRRTWRQSARPQDYPPVTDADLVWMCYPSAFVSMSPGAQRLRLMRARNTLQTAMSMGLCVRHPCGAILPGSNWIGQQAGVQ